MKSTLRRHWVTLLVGVSALCAPAGAGRDPSHDGKSAEPINARTLLEKGQATGSLPEEMIVRVGACLGAADVKAAGDQEAEFFKETWEFTSNQVHRAVADSKDKKVIYRRVESRPFDSKGLCKELLDGNAIEIQARKGVGPEIAFVGSNYHAGSRWIEVEWKGKTVLDLGECDGPLLVLYRESDARAFGALYERLASQARAAFNPKHSEAR